MGIVAGTAIWLYGTGSRPTALSWSVPVLMLGWAVLESAPR
jgi:hypothetical protein